MLRNQKFRGNRGRSSSGWYVQNSDTLAGKIGHATDLFRHHSPSGGLGARLIKPDFTLRRSARQREFPIIAAQQRLNRERDMIVSPHLAVLTVAMFLVAAPAALAHHSSKARKHHKLTSVSTSACCNAPDPGASFLSAAPHSYWKQFRSMP